MRQKSNQQTTTVAKFQRSFVALFLPTAAVLFFYSPAQATAEKRRTPATSSLLNGQISSYQPAFLAAADAVKRGQDNEAVKLFTESLKSEKDPTRQALAHLAIGEILLRLGRGEPELHLKQAIEQGTKLSDYAFFLLGKWAYQAQKYDIAQSNLNKAMQMGIPARWQRQALQLLGEIDYQQGQYRAAQKTFTKLRKKLKGQLEYPTAVLWLGKSDRKLDPRGGGCRWLREVWSKYPSAAPEWSGPLAQVEIDGKATRCATSEKEFQTRIRRLQVAGESQKALSEIEARKDLVGYSRDQLLAQYWINEGQVTEALQLLLKHFNEHQGRVPYLNLLAKATSRANEAESAIALFDRVYQLAGRGKLGREALFQGAFTSYLFQDYDSAAEKFAEYVRVFGGSKKSYDARWYIAWMNYLRGNYDTAYANFESMWKAKVPRRRRARIGVENRERYLYWMAMAKLKQGQPEAALEKFHQLSRDPNLGYYSLAAFHRMEQIFTEKPLLKNSIAVRKDLPNIWNEEDLRDRRDEDEPPAAASADEEAESEEEDTEDVAEGAADAAGEAQANGEDLQEAVGPEITAQKKFERAAELVAIGMMDEARDELLEVERRARGIEERRALLQELPQAEGYYRSSFLAEVTFGAQRVREGLRGARHLWEACYPQAFHSSVTKTCEEAQVPKEFVWAIMRAESHFRPDAQSPVGALGLMQLMPFTARNMAGAMQFDNFSVKDLFTPEVNIRLGTFYLSRLLKTFSGQIPLAAAAYNAGPHRVLSWTHFFGNLEMDAFVEHIPFVETRNYVKKVVRNYHAYISVYSGKNRETRWLIDSVIRDGDIPSANTPVW